MTAIEQVLRHDAVEQLKCAEGELVLDFASVPRIDASAAGALEELADAADKASVKVVLSGVNIDVYRVLKLLRLARRFSVRS